MRRWLFTLALVSAAALGQEKSASDLPKIDPNMERALKNALRGFHVPAFQTFFAKPQNQDERCAIPLLTAPVNPETDKGIVHKIPDGAPMDGMPIVKGLPACGSKP